MELADQKGLSRLQYGWHQRSNLEVFCYGMHYPSCHNWNFYNQINFCEFKVQIDVEMNLAARFAFFNKSCFIYGFVLQTEIHAHCKSFLWYLGMVKTAIFLSNGKLRKNVWAIFSFHLAYISMCVCVLPGRSRLENDCQVNWFQPYYFSYEQKEH